MSSRRQNFAVTPRALDPVRARRASQMAAAGRVVGPGQRINRASQIVPNLGDVFYIDANGQQQVRIDEETLQIVTGSPRRIAGRVAPAMVEAVEEGVEANAEDIADLDARTQAFVLDHETRIQDLESNDSAQDTSILDHETRLDEIDEDRTPQPFTSDGVLDQTLGLIYFVTIDNTGGNVQIDVSPVARAELNVKVIGYDGGNNCRLRATSGNFDGAGTYDFVAVLDSARFLCDGTDWWKV